ncbi:MAG: ribonuclease Z [Chloroflexota bacterium]
MIDVFLLGAGGMMPLPDRPLSALVARIEGRSYLFDCGEGTQVNWRVSDVSFRSLGTILFSHMHADHVAGLPGVLFQIAFSGRTDPVTIYGPRGTVRVIEALLTIVGKLPFDLEVIEVSAEASIELTDDLTLHTMELSHRVPALGFRLDHRRAPRFHPDRARALGIPQSLWSELQAGRETGGFNPADVLGPPRPGLSLAFITDTRLVDGIVDFVRDSNLLVSECTYVDDEDIDRALERGHLTMRQATSIGRDANVGELWLTHFSPKVERPEDYEEQARRMFARTRIGYPGLGTTLRFRDDDSVGSSGDETVDHRT